MAKAKKSQTPSVTKEVAELSKQVERALRAAAHSPELRDIGAEITTGFQKVGAKVVAAVESARESEQGQLVGRQLKKVIDTGREKGLKTATEVRGNLIKGLRGIGSELAKIAERIENRQKG